MATATASKKKTKVNFRPTDDRVLLQPCEAEQKTAGGIILPDAAQEKPQRGTVVGVGPGKMLKSGKRGEMSLAIGDEVFYGRYSGTEVEFDAGNMVVVRESDVLAVIDK